MVAPDPIYVERFLAERCELSGETQMKVLYAAYEDWRRDNCLGPSGVAVFSRILRLVVPGVRMVTRGKYLHTFRVVIGVRLVSGRVLSE